ncbi:MAG TPA: LptF/LptG family permease [Bacteroidales bacterium]|nr:LptF/LptG family permease [Bacteroidales bacterium]
MENNDGKKSLRKTLRILKIKIIDRYIIRKFLGTFFFSLVLILTIAVVFDLAEKIDNFMENSAPLKAIVLDYYMNFIPYFATLFAPLFVFISVIFFTSKLAVNTEIIAILNSGMSFRRMMLPYFLSAVVIAVFTFTLTNFVIPHSNLRRMDFENQYYRARGNAPKMNLHRKLSDSVYLYMESYNPLINSGKDFTLDQFDDSGKLVSKLSSMVVTYDSVLNKWKAVNYYIRDIKDGEEVITQGESIDTTLAIRPVDLSRDPAFVGTMTYTELNDYIKLLRLQGSEEIKIFLVEKHRRFSNPFAIFILTLIGVSLSSVKKRGGIGMNIGIGLTLSFSYILFLQFASQFSLKGNLEPMLAMWIPNILYTIIALVLYKIAPK